MIGEIAPEVALASLIAEYPDLAAWELAFERRFAAGEGRLSNAFLIQARSGAVSQFVAKAMAPTVEDPLLICEEWRALRLASGSNCVARLLMPDHEPTQFLLLEYIEGPTAEEAVQTGSPAAVFGAIGETLRALHRIPAPRYGMLGAPGPVWPDLIAARITPKIDYLRAFLSPERHRQAVAEIEGLLLELVDEPDAPILMHRDVYLWNFILSPSSGNAHLVDFGMAWGGRPLYDLVKLYILDLYRYPEARDAFVSAYFCGSCPRCFEPLMRLYLYVELLGMVRYFDRQGQKPALAHALAVMNEMIDGRGRILDLL